MHILLVDDNIDIIRLVEQVLKYDGHRITIARDGLEALQLAQSIQPDAMVLDVNMPRMDGWEVCERVKQHSNIPIMLLTVHANQADFERGASVGADAYLPKPFDIHTFLNHLHSMLDKHYGPDR